MNVYVRALAGALARAGVECDVYTRSEDRSQPRVIEVEPGFRVVHVEAGPQQPVPRFELPGLVDAFIDAAEAHLEAGPPVDVLHGNYWLSGAVAHQLKHRRDLPMVATFHTLARVKADAGVDDDPEQRSRVEHDVINCSDLMLASTEAELEQLVTHYGAVPERVEIVPPGVDHSVFFPDDARVAKDRLGLDGKRTLLFVGRIQPLKGVGLAVRCLAELDDPETILLVVGGPSGPDGAEELARTRAARGRARRGRQRAVRPAAAPHPARRLLPRRRRVHRSVSRRVVRARRARKPRPAARRSSRRRWAGCARSSTTVRPASSSTTAIPRRTRRRSRCCSTIRHWPPRSARARRRGHAGTRGASPRRACAGSTAISSHEAWCAATDASTDLALDEEFRAAKHALIAAHLEGPVAVSRGSRPSSTTRRSRAGTCASVATDATRRRSTSTSTSARCATRCTSSPTRPQHHEALYRFMLQRNHGVYGAHFSIGPDGDCYLVGRVLPRAPRRRRARSHHRRALRARRAVVPGRDRHRLPSRVRYLYMAEIM